MFILKTYSVKYISSIQIVEEIFFYNETNFLTAIFIGSYLAFYCNWYKLET